MREPPAGTGGSEEVTAMIVEHDLSGPERPCQLPELRRRVEAAQRFGAMLLGLGLRLVEGTGRLESPFDLLGGAAYIAGGLHGHDPLRADEVLRLAADQMDRHVETAELVCRQGEAGAALWREVSRELFGGEAQGLLHLLHCLEVDRCE